MAYFRSDIDIIVFFLLGGYEWSAGLFNKKIFFFYLVGSPKVGGAGDGKHKKKYGHPNHGQPRYIITPIYMFWYRYVVVTFMQYKPVI